MKKNDFYGLMCTFDANQDFNTIHQNWKTCFTEYFRRLKLGFSNRAIEDLFYNFEMSNWDGFHIENTEYHGKTKAELIEYFCYETKYISDRMSYDRLFRTHWLFKQAFRKELFNLKYGRTIFSIEA